MVRSSTKGVIFYPKGCGEAYLIQFCQEVADKAESLNRTKPGNANHCRTTCWLVQFSTKVTPGMATSPALSPSHRCRLEEGVVSQCVITRTTGIFRSGHVRRPNFKKG